MLVLWFWMTLGVQVNVVIKWLMDSQNTHLWVSGNYKESLPCGERN